MSFNTTYNNIEFVLEDGAAILTFNRPDSLNSFNAEMHAEVREALKEVKKNPEVRALVITGNGRGFCAGQDLSDRNVAPGTEAPNLGESIEKNYNPMIRSIRALEMPVICAVNGVAAGAGANIALACDIVFAAKSAKFIQAFCKIGLIPDSGGTWTLPHTVGQARAMALSMLGDRLTAEDAEKIGMIWKAVDDEAVKETAIATAKDLATQPTKGLALIKRAIQASATNSLDEQLDLERDLQTIAGRTEDYREGVAAFMEKRQPSFKGQ